MGQVHLVTENGLEVYRNAPGPEWLGTAEFIVRTESRPNAWSKPLPAGVTGSVIYDNTIYVAVRHRVVALRLPLFPPAAAEGQAGADGD